MDALKELVASQLKADAPEILIGSTVKVHVRIKEGEKERIQIFEGTVIAKNNSGIAETFTVRRVSYGVGVERVFPLESPRVVKVELVRPGKVRRAKIYYVRDKIGKAAKIKALVGAKANEEVAASRAAAKASDSEEAAIRAEAKAAH